MSLLLRPRFIALDTSHLGQWAKAGYSHQAAEREQARRFSDWLHASSSIPLLTLHHLIELGSHNDQDVVSTRLRFLGSLPLVAWISGTGDRSLGGVTSILTAEISAALANAGGDIVKVRDVVRPAVIEVGTGADMLGPNPDLWMMLTPDFKASTARDRELVALTHSDLIDLHAVPMSRLLAGRRHDDAKLDGILNIMRGSIARDISDHGDRRIQSAHSVAERFVASVRDMAASLPRDPAEMVWAALALQGIEPSDIDPESTIGEVLDLGVFLQQMRLTTKGSDLPWSELKRRVSIEKIPSSTIIREVRRQLPKTAERKGSEVNDLHIASVAAYADVTLVDKRMEVAFRQARRNNRDLDRTCRSVVKAKSYSEIPEVIDGR